jgi:hypothetical protein
VPLVCTERQHADTTDPALSGSPQLAIASARAIVACTSFVMPVPLPPGVTALTAVEVGWCFLRELIL